jgi:hypothetical protein
LAVRVDREPCDGWVERCSPRQATVALRARQISSILAGSSVAIFSTGWFLAIVERLSKLVTHARGSPARAGSSVRWFRSQDATYNDRRYAPKALGRCCAGPQGREVRPSALGPQRQGAEGLGRCGVPDGA